MLDTVLLFATFFAILIILCSCLLVCAGTAVLLLTCWRSYLYQRQEIKMLGEEISPNFKE